MLSLASRDPRCIITTFLLQPATKHFLMCGHYGRQRISGWYALATATEKELEVFWCLYRAELIEEAARAGFVAAGEILFEWGSADYLRINGAREAWSNAFCERWKA